MISVTPKEGAVVTIDAEGGICFSNWDLHFNGLPYSQEAAMLAILHYMTLTAMGCLPKKSKGKPSLTLVKTER